MGILAPDNIECPESHERWMQFILSRAEAYRRRLSNTRKLRGRKKEKRLKQNSSIIFFKVVSLA